MSRYAAKRDSNHGEIERVFRKMLADHVTNTSSLGCGVGDLFVSFGSYSAWIEIKSDPKITHRPADKPYTAHQVRFQNAHPHAVLRCETEDQAIELCKLIRERARRLG